MVRATFEFERDHQVRGELFHDYLTQRKCGMLGAMYPLLDKALAHIDHRLGPRNPLLQFRLRRVMRRRHSIDIRFNADTIELERGGKVLRLPIHQWSYAHSVAGNFDAHFATLEGVREDDRTVLDFSTPRTHRYRGSGFEYLLTSLPEEPEAIESYFAKGCPASGDLVFDAGANCGVTAHRLSALVGSTGKVIAFEPDPSNHAALCQNIARHGLSNVVPVQNGLAGKTGSYIFNADAALGSGISSFIPWPSTGEIVTIECLSMSDAIKQFGAPSFIKMDIEGAELSVLRNAHLDTLRCSFTVDTGHLVGGHTTAERCEALFRKSDYESGTLREGGYVTTWATPL
jgi:FkbM family methyltransferase